MNIKKLHGYSVLGTGMALVLAANVAMASSPAEVQIRLDPESKRIEQPLVKRHAVTPEIKASRPANVPPAQNYQTRPAVVPTPHDGISASDKFLSLDAESEEMKDAQRTILLLQQMLQDG
jgi:hypothetical protein